MKNIKNIKNRTLFLFLILTSVTCGHKNNFPWVFSIPSIGISFLPTIGEFGIEDLDNDGIPEVVVINEMACIYVINGKDGSLLWTRRLGQFSLEYNFYTSPFIGDIDNDKKNEIVLLYYGKIWAVNGENGSILWASDKEGWYGSLAIGDLDGDGKNDVFAHCTAFKGKDGSLLWRYCPEGSNFIPALGDIDSDGKLEVVFGTDETLVTSGWPPYTYIGRVYALNGEDGSLLWEYETDHYVSSVPLIGDIDNDGKFEVVMRGGELALNGEDGSLLWFVPYRDGWSALGDIDNDGRLEIVVGGRTTDYPFNGEHEPPPLRSIIYAINGEDGSLLWNYLFPLDKGIDTYPVICDINGDGKLDVLIGVVESEPGSGFVIRKLYAFNGEDGAILRVFEPLKDFPDAFLFPDVVDLNNDGKIDFIGISFDRKKIFVFSTDAPFPPPNLSPWPRWRHDSKGTSLYTGSSSPPW
jgi:outer membrane protein assembly factor BamB